MQTTGSVDLIESIFVAAPGTEILMDEDSPGKTERILHTLQHAKHGDGHILLVPQPSLTDPNDPLHWSTPKKWIVLANGVAYAFNGAVTGPMMAFVHLSVLNPYASGSELSQAGPENSASTLKTRLQSSAPAHLLKPVLNSS